MKDGIRVTIEAEMKERWAPSVTGVQTNIFSRLTGQGKGHAGSHF